MRTFIHHHRKTPSPTVAPVYRTAHNTVAGATFVEFALVIPLVVLIVFFFFEMGRYMFIYTALNSGADSAVQFATKVAGLEAEPNSSEFIEAQNATLARATAAANKAFVQGQAENSSKIKSTELILPAASAARTIEQALAEDPIQVVIEAQIQPFLPFFPTLPIRVVAEGFRERTKGASIPIPSDCNGYPLGSPNFKKFACPCPPERVWSSALEQCVCKFPYGALEDCGCPEPAIPTTGDGGWTCTCPDAETLGCSDTEERLETWEFAPQDPSSYTNISCSCACKPGFVPGEEHCECPPNRRNENGTCVCDVPCSDGKVANPDSCECECPAGSITIGGGDCGCANPNFAYNPQTGRCVCNITSCPPGEIYDATNCACLCPTDKVRDSNGECVCAAPKIAGVGGSCVCETQPSDCGPNMVVDPNTCNCICAPTFTHTGGTAAAPTGCACPAAKVEIDGACKCPTDPCGPNMTRDSKTCLCKCKSGFVSNGPDSCGCPSGKVQSGSSCVCAENNCVSPKVQNKSTCACECPKNWCTGGVYWHSSCNCSCFGSQVPINGVCTCPDDPCPQNATKNSSTCECACNSGYVAYDGKCASNSCYQMIMSGADCTVRANGTCHCSEG